MRTRHSIALAVTVAAASSLRAQMPLWAGLTAGPYAVGFRTVDTIDATRSFPSRDGRVAARPMRLYVWYPARPRTGSPMHLSDLVDEAWANGGVMAPLNPLAFRRTIVRVRSGPAFASMGDIAADSLLALPLASHRNAAAAAGRFPIVLLAPGQPLTMPVAAELLASNGIIVISPGRKADRTFESLEFTPTAASIDTEADDLAFALGYARARSNARAADVGLLAYSSSGLSSLAFALRSRAPRAIAVFEGWEAWDAGQPFVRNLRGYDPRGFRSAYLLLEKAAEEAAPAFRKTSAFFDSMAYAPRWRIAFDDAAHPDFASLGVALQSSPPTLRRNFARAHELLRDFFLAELGGGPRPSATWASPLAETWMHVAYSAPRAAVPTFDEFFHLAEVEPASADTIARRLAAMSPPVVPFTESSLSRLALLASSRNAEQGSVLYGIVVRAFPRSLNAQVGLSDALASSGRAADARAAARSALDLLATDTTMADAQKQSIRRRLTARTAP